MTDIRRYYIPNSIVFITAVTNNRLPIFHEEGRSKLFLETTRKVQEIHPFNLLAYVILPDHFHWLMKTHDPGGDFSKNLHSVKRNFTLNVKAARQVEKPLQLWQSRFWDHVIRNERDSSLHFDYIHWNPIKHGYV